MAILIYWCAYLSYYLNSEVYEKSRTKVVTHDLLLILILSVIIIVILLIVLVLVIIIATRESLP